MRLRPLRKYVVHRVYDKAVYQRNRFLMQTYGLRNNTVIAKFEGMVEKARHVYNNYKPENNCRIAYCTKLVKYHILTKDEKDTLLALTVDAFLKRTLQYIVSKNYGMTINKARQCITTGQVLISHIKCKRPTRLISAEAESQVVLRTQ